MVLIPLLVGFLLLPGCKREAVSLKLAEEKEKREVLQKELAEIGEQISELEKKRSVVVTPLDESSLMTDESYAKALAAVNNEISEREKAKKKAVEKLQDIKRLQSEHLEQRFKK